MKRMRIFWLSASLLMLAVLAAFPPDQPRAAATLTVNNAISDTADANPGNGICADANGTCTLRAAIQEANALAGTDTISFNIPGAGVKTVAPATGLPAITDPVVIDGTTQAGFTGSPVIELNGLGAGFVAGLRITAGSSTVKGLVINRFTLGGITLVSGSNTIQGCYIGTDVTGTLDRGNGAHGIEISGNDNTIGGTNSATRNVISGNSKGIRIVSGATGNLVQGNFIGTDKNGTADLGNSGVGVEISNVSTNTIGGTVTGTRNIISGNDSHGIIISANTGTASNNLVRGNFIGTDVNGTADLGNSTDGIQISGATDNTIGGTTASHRNIISGNGASGVRISTDATGNIVQGNFIGTVVNGTADLGNTTGGVIISDSPTNTIGGTTAGARNIISGNDDNGILIIGSSATGNLVQNNFIGTDVNGTADLGNSTDGIEISGATQNTIGGMTVSARNIISGNGASGVLLSLNAAANSVQGNFIGTDVNGTADLGNTAAGVTISDSPTNAIGGSSTGARNIISGNDDNGILIIGSSATGNLVQNNFIGTDVNGAADLGNTSNGLEIDGALDNLIGGTNQGNNIAHNGAKGLVILSGTGNNVRGNSIFSNGSLGIDLGNNGVTPNDASDPDIGANNLQNFPLILSAIKCAAGTLISGTINSTPSTALDIQFFSTPTCDASGNGEGQVFLGTAFVVTDPTGNVSFTFTGPASVILGHVITATAIRFSAPRDTSEFSPCVTVTDLTVTNTGNSGSGSLREAILTANACAGLDTIRFNIPGAGVKTIIPTSFLPDILDPVIIDGATQPGFAGTPLIELDNNAGTVGFGLVISGGGGGTTVKGLLINRFVSGGVLLSTAGNTIQGCYIGTDATGTADLGNTNGVSITGDNNNIGGTTPGAGNTIAFNTRGINIGASAQSNSVRGNSIYSNDNLGIDLGTTGVTPNDLGDPDTGANNLQNFPVLTSFTSSSVSGSLNSTPQRQFRLEFFANASCDSSGNGEGQVFLGFQTVSTDVNGNTNFTFNFTPVQGKPVITATATDNNTNDTSEFSACLTGPTYVDLVSFEATGYKGGVLLEWQTGFEADNLGFNIYRDESGKRTVVNHQLVAGSALTAGSSVLAGQSYAWWDPSIADCRLSIADCQKLAYWLEDVDLKGLSTLHGPFYAQPSVGNAQSAVQTAKTLASLNTAEAPSVPLEFRASLMSSNSIPLGQLQSLIADSHSTLKLQIKREAWYQVSGRELLAAGLPGVDPRNLQIFVDGKQQPIRVTGQEDGRLDSTDTLEFYGAGIESPFTELRTYYLVAAKQAGLRIATIDSSAHPSPGGSFESTVERRDRSIYFAALRNGDLENFFGAVVASQPVNQTLTLNHLSGSPASARLTVALQGVTSVQHAVSVSINGNNVGQLVFHGQALAETTISIPSSLLLEGENQVTLTTLGGASDVSLVDHIRVSYQHSLTADDNLLKLSAEPGQQLTIQGFTSPEIQVFDVTDPFAMHELAGYVSKNEAGTFAVSLTVPGANGQRWLLALTKDKASAVASIESDYPSSLRNTAQSADLLIISTRELFDSLQPLKELRQRQGMAVTLVDIEDIYDEFSFGQKSPYAVRDFLGWAGSRWKRKPRFVLFAGDASYDPKNYLGLGSGDLVPTKLVATDFMETASDDWLADFDEDGVADLAIGRLPARTAEEASLLVSKIIFYERSSPPQEILLAADENDGFDFEAASSQLASLVPPSIKVTLVNRGRVGTETAKKILLDGIHRGQKLVNYTGHGSANQWRGNLLTNADVLSLRNNRLPVFAMMTCLNNYFNDPAGDSLGESLLKAERGGAVAVWASSGMTLPMDQALMNQELYRQLFNQTRAITLGEAVMRAKSSIGDSNIRRTWILIGDPAMKLK